MQIRDAQKIGLLLGHSASAVVYQPSLIQELGGQNASKIPLPSDIWTWLYTYTHRWTLNPWRNPNHEPSAAARRRWARWRSSLWAADLVCVHTWYVSSQKWKYRNSRGVASWCLPTHLYLWTRWTIVRNIVSTGRTRRADVRKGKGAGRSKWRLSYCAFEKKNASWIWNYYDSP